MTQMMIMIILVCLFDDMAAYLFLFLQMIMMTIALLFSIHLNGTMIMILLEMHVTTVSLLPTHYKRILITMGLEESVMLMTMMEVSVSIMFLLVDTSNGSIVPKSS